MKTLILSILLLVSLSSNSLFADTPVLKANTVSAIMLAGNYSNIPPLNNHKRILNAAVDTTTLPDFSPIRQITQSEFDGKVPIQLFLNQQLVIPFSFTPHYLDNKSHGLGVKDDLNILLCNLSLPLASDGLGAFNAIKVTIFCTSKELGQTKLKFYFDETLEKEWVVNVVDSISNK